MRLSGIQDDQRLVVTVIVNCAADWAGVAAPLSDSCSDLEWRKGLQ